MGILHQELELLNYRVVVLEASPHLLGIPQHRQRLYIIGFSGEIADNEVTSFAEKIYYECQSPHDKPGQMLDINRFLLPDDHPLVTSELTRMKEAKVTIPPIR